MLNKQNQTKSTLYYSLNMKLYNVFNMHIKIMLHKINIKDNIIPRKQ